MKSHAFEQWYPFIGGILAALIYYVWFFNCQLPSKISDLFPQVVTISAIAIGFLATLKSILLSLSDKEVIDNIKKLGLYDSLISYLWVAIHFCFILSIYSAIWMIFDLKKIEQWHNYVFMGWLFVCSTALLLSYRVISILTEILKACA